MLFEKSFYDLEQTVRKINDSIPENLYKDWENNYLKLHQQRYFRCLEDVKQFTESNDILEIGGVPFHFSTLLKLQGYDVIVADPKPERSIQIAQHYSHEVVKCDIEVNPLPFKDDLFSTILLMEVIEHLYINPLHALREIARVLMPGGKLLLYTDNLYSLKILKKFVLGRSINNALLEWKKLENLGHRGHIRLYSTRELYDMLFEVGLIPVSHHYHHYGDSFRTRLKYKLIPTRLHPNQLVIATKSS